MTIQSMQEARLKKALDTLHNYTFDAGVMTLREFLDMHHIIRLTATTRNHETKRRELEYKPLSKPVTEYTVWYTDADRELGIDIPKVVYDYLNLPKENKSVEY